MRNTSSLLKDVIFATQISKTETKPEESQTTKKKWKQKNRRGIRKTKEKTHEQKTATNQAKISPSSHTPSQI